MVTSMLVHRPQGNVLVNCKCPYNLESSEARRLGGWRERSSRTGRPRAHPALDVDERAALSPRLRALAARAPGVRRRPGRRWHSGSALPDARAEERGDFTRAVLTRESASREAKSSPTERSSTGRSRQLAAGLPVVPLTSRFAATAAPKLAIMTLHSNVLFPWLPWLP